MAKATLTLPDGTVVYIEGTQMEVQQLLEFYGHQPTKKSMRLPKVDKTKGSDKKDLTGVVDYAEIVRLVKDCDEAETIEKRILDRSSQVDRTLLPLYIVNEYLNNSYGLTSGDVNKVTTDLGIPISQPAASRALSGTAKRYVIGDKMKKKGQPVRYKLSRRGVQYMKAVLEGKESGG